MSENPRETQFTGFAQLLFDELCSRNDMYIDSINEHWEEEWKKIIARRAYDLACHILHETAYGFDLFNIPDRVNEIPDLTKWPEAK